MEKAAEPSTVFARRCCASGLGYYCIPFFSRKRFQSGAADFPLVMAAKEIKTDRVIPAIQEIHLQLWQRLGLNACQPKTLREQAFTAVLKEVASDGRRVEYPRNMSPLRRWETESAAENRMLCRQTHSLQRNKWHYTPFHLMKLPRLQFRFLRSLGLNSVAILLTVTAARALVIDDFTQGPIPSLQGTNTAQAGTTLVQPGLNPASVLGGTRSVYVGSLSLATVSTDPIKGRFRFTANQNFGYFTLGWGSVSPLNVNLSADGNNRFRFELTDSSPLFTAGIFQLRVKSGNNWFNTDIKTDLASALNGQTFGVMNIPFARFSGADFTAVQAIELYAARVPAEQSLQFDFISTVPEPSVLALAGVAGGIGLWRRRQKQ